MQQIFLLPPDKKQFKANLHTHSTYSDGVLTPEQIKALYKEHGYHIVAYTDHNTLNYFKELDDENFLALCGYELNVYEHDTYAGFEKTCHINAIARDPNHAVLIPRPTKYSVDVINETIEELYQNNFIIHYNHPCWSSEEPTDYIHLKHLSAMEIYNNASEVESNNGDARPHYDLMLKHGMRLNCIAADDNHNHNMRPDEKRITTSDSCGGYTMILAESLTYDNIINALDNGHYYCCMGEGAPEVYNYYLKDNKLCIDCSPCSGIFFKCNTINPRYKQTSATDSITHAELDLADLWGGETYIRIELVDTKRRMTFTNPFYLDDYTK